MFKGLKKPEKKPIEVPTVDQLEQEYERVRYNRRYRSVLASTIYALVTVAAVSVLVATLLLPVLQIYGTSMTPSLIEGDIVVSIKGSSFNEGDIISFYYNNKILVKRVIAQEGEWVDIDDDGNVYVNGVELEEPYIAEKALGDCDIDLPYQVPEGRIFVMGDHRATSQDSRSSAIGCVSEEQIVGKIVFRVWPLKEFGTLD
ncbi:MAG: signal peptidase I [Lachnospiraceae bacterium]|nr:signal peptidase I [Lachnospiraceae bacterium]